MKKKSDVSKQKFLIDSSLLDETSRIALLISLQATQFMLKNLFWMTSVPTTLFFWMENLFNIARNLNGVIDDASFGTLVMFKHLKEIHYVDQLIPVLNH